MTIRICSLSIHLTAKKRKILLNPMLFPKTRSIPNSLKKMIRQKKTTMNLPLMKSKPMLFRMKKTIKNLTKKMICRRIFPMMKKIQKRMKMMTIPVMFWTKTTIFLKKTTLNRQRVLSSIFPRKSHLKRLRCFQR